jgi:hypothetical protein
MTRSLPRGNRARRALGVSTLTSGWLKVVSRPSVDRTYGYALFTTDLLRASKVFQFPLTFHSLVLFVICVPLTNQKPTQS